MRQIGAGKALVGAAGVPDPASTMATADRTKVRQIPMQTPTRAVKHALISRGVRQGKGQALRRYAQHTGVDDTMRQGAYHS
jgi:hypothetical protein